MDEIKTMLLQEKDKLIEHLGHQFHENEEEHDIGDEVDSSVEEQGRELTFLLHDRERKKLEQIDDALDRIESSDYGYCEECGEPIAKKRLLVVPFARYCVQCQQEVERNSLNTTGPITQETRKYMMGE